MKKLIKIMLSLALFSGYVIVLNSCSEEAPFQITRSESSNFNDQLPKKRSTNIAETIVIQEASGTVYFKPSLNHYAGTGFGHPNGSQFILQPESLTPPDEIPWGENVTITMKVEKDLTNGQLIYTFDPSGCTFEPAAVLWISWSDLGTDSANLYYIDKRGRFIELTPDDIDYEGKKFKVLITHFSRYAVAYSD